MPGRYGKWNKHLELFDVFEAFRRNPKVLERFAQDGDAGGLMEATGSGSPEGRVDFPIFLQTVIHHRIRERFRGVASRWEDYFGIEPAQDFREHTVSELGAIRGFEGVEEHGVYPRLRSWEAEGPSYQVGKYGGIYSVTYELIINDALDMILNRIPGELGRSMAEYVAQAMITLMESNATYSPDSKPFYAESRGNLVTGEAAELDEDNIMAMLDTMALHRDRDNVPIMIDIEKIIVRAPSQAAIINRMVRSTQTGVRSEQTAAGAPDFARGDYNALADALPNDVAQVEPWLNSPTDYYLLANAQDRPAFVAAFLRNQTEPAIFLKDSGLRGVGGGNADPYTMDFDEIPYKVRHVFGGAVGEPLATVKAQP
jgi:hypothetical protein